MYTVPQKTGHISRLSLSATVEYVRKATLEFIFAVPTSSDLTAPT